MKSRSRFHRRERKPLTLPTESKVQHGMAAAQDVNAMVDRYLKGGPNAVLGNPAATRQPVFGDFTSIDFQDMQNAVVDIESNFRRLPARMRSRFDNSPYQLLRFVENPENLAESIKLGLILDPAADMADPFEKDPNQQDLVETAANADSKAEVPSEPLTEDDEANPRKAAKKPR